jgi:magnesium transporter
MTNKRTDLDSEQTFIHEAMESGDWTHIVQILEELLPPDQADLFIELPVDVQDQLLPILDPEIAADILEKLDEEDAARIASRLDAKELARILNKMEPDEAADLLGDISLVLVDEVLPEMDRKEEIRLLIEYQDETAGGLMTSAEVVLHEGLTASEAMSHLRTIRPDSDAVSYLFVVNDEMCLVGGLSLRQLVLASPSAQIGEIMEAGVKSVQPDTDQEEAARLLARYDILLLPVIDDNGHLLGIITHDDMVEVIEEEATEDILRLGGIPMKEESEVRILPSLRNRLPWLLLNLATAMASAVVLGLFKNTIAQVAILVAFFPLVAGVSGSAGTQTLTVIVRRLALGELKPKDGVPALFREMIIGLSNGLVLGIVVAIIALVWQGNPMLGMVVGLATFLNLFTAAIAGVLFPLGMQFLRIDPALASPVLVTTLTDTMGYLIYLGIATLVLVRLQ